ncbi:MAG: hypothetical protein J5654_12800 [Victivallales bacterium]|nr:hypothetical protein [Victivallales bacterium]
MKKTFTLVVIAILASLLLPAFTLTAAEFSVPFLKQAPVIDGRFDAGEWDFALAISGSAKKMDPRRTTLWLGYDQTTLYVALQGETPPRGKLSTSTHWLSHHDSLELWFAPPSEKRTIEALKFGVFQMIVDFEATLQAQHHSPGYGLNMRQWKHGAQIQSRVEDGLWTMEMAFPLKAMGVEGAPEGDWRMMFCRNYGVTPRVQCPMTDVASFEDPTNYSVFHLSRECLAFQQLYAPETRLPLLFRVANPTDQPASAELAVSVSGETERTFEAAILLNPNQEVIKDFTQRCAAEGGKCKVAVTSPGLTREVTWNPPEPPIWRNLESYQTLFCSMDADAKAIVDYAADGNAEVKLSSKLEGELPVVQGPMAARRVLDLTGGSITFPKTTLSSPGAVTFWMQVSAPLAEGKEYRRFFGTDYKPNGYLYFQEQRQGGLLLGVQGFGPENKNPKNVLLGRRPAPGQWMHLAFNFLPDAIEVYVNGLRRAQLQHNLKMDLSTVGGALIANAAFADFAIYSRPLDAAEITALAQGDKPVTGTIAWYQSLNQPVADLVLDCDALPEKKLVLQIRNEQDKAVETLPLDFTKGYSSVVNGHERAILHVALPLTRKLPDGKYSFFVTKPDADYPIYEKNFFVKDYPWLNNSIGKADRLIDGFTPLKRNGNTLSAVLKDVELGENGLPAAVTANGKSVLARPVAVIAEANGVPLKWRCQAPAFTGESDTLITAEGELECDALKIRAKIRMEQDGLLRYDWTLLPGKASLPTRLYVDIPVRADVATLYHAVGEGLRSNPAGYVPQGQGLLFSSKEVPQKRFDSFLPYLWVGNEYRGICYAADWDKGWCHSKQRDGVELLREPDGTVVIRLNLLNEPKKLQKDNTITFALLASPVKPMPQGWRGWRDAFTKKGTQLSRALYANLYWGCFYNWTGRYPAFQDFEYWDKLFEAQRTGVVDQDYINSWVERLMNAYGTVETGSVNSLSKDAAHSIILNHTRAAFNITSGLHDIDNSIVYCYTCDGESTARLPEYPVMKDEWGGGLLISDSYVDYAIYYLDKMVEHGFKGIYNDNVFLESSSHWATGGAWIDEAGAVHPSLGLWRCREFNRRQAVTMMDHGVKPWITMHHTNTNILPTVGLATNTMGMEWKYGVNDFQERFSSDYIRAVCAGLQGGCFPTVLDGITGAKTPEVRIWATRTMLASLLPHEVQPTCPRDSSHNLIKATLDRLYDFGTWQDDCVVYNFWDEESPVKCSNDDLKQVTYRIGKELLTFVGSYADEDCTAEMDYGANVAEARDDESDQALETSGSTVKFSLKKHDFIIIRATLE